MSPLRAVLAAEPLLTAADVVRLARQIEAGVLAREARLGGRSADASVEELELVEELGTQAWHRFVRANLRLVAMVSAQAAARTGLSEADLFQEGCLGLMTAVQRFDHARGHTFATYALFWIRSAVGAATARQLGALNLPTSRAEQLRTARGRQAELAQELGRPPSTAEVAAALGRPESWTRTLLASQPPESLERLAAPERWVADPEAEPATAAVDISALLRRLPSAEREVLELRFGLTGSEPCSRSETARRLSTTPARVRGLEERGLEHLRELCPQSARALLP